MLLMLLLLPIIQCHWRLVAEPPNARIEPPTDRAQPSA
jgi:hypothetical protein